MERWVQFGLGVAAGVITFAAGSHLYALWRQKKRLRYRRPCYRSPLGLWNSEGPEVLESTRGASPPQSNTEATEDHDHGLLNCLYAIAEDQARRHGVHHRGVSCNSCQASPISGVRYKCANCIDYDVCEKCLASCNHDQTHTFLRISIPVCPLTNPRSPVLSRSLYQGQSNSYSRALLWEEITHLQSTTHFVQSEIESLFQQFCCLAAGHGGIPRHVFNECLGPLGLEHNLIVERLFAFYDQDHNGWIDFHEFCRGLSILTKGNRDEKVRPAFNGFDLEKCGYIRRQDFRRIFKAYFFVTVELVRDVVRACEDEMLEGFEDDPSKPVSAMFNAPIPARLQSSGDISPGGKPPLPPGTPGLIARRQESGIWPVLEAVSQDAVEELVETVMSGADTNSDGRVSYEEFSNYVVVDPTVLAWLDALGPVF